MEFGGTADIDAGGERGIDDGQLEAFPRAAYGVAALEGEAVGLGLGSIRVPRVGRGVPP